MKALCAAVLTALLCGPVSAQIKHSPHTLAGKPAASKSAVQEVRQASEDQETYELTVSFLPMEGRKKLDLGRHSAVVHLLYADGFYLSAPLTRNLSASPDRVSDLMATVRVKRRLKDLREAVISHIEVLVSKGRGSADDEWELFDVVARGSAFAVKNPSKHFEWEERNFFPRLQVIRPGQVVTSALKAPMQEHPAWMDEDHVPASNLYVELMIGRDDVKTSYRTLDLRMRVADKPDEEYRSTVAGDGAERQLLTGGLRLFAPDSAQLRKINHLDRQWTDRQGHPALNGIHLRDVAHLALVYEFGDHGSFENDDWDLVGLCVNRRGSDDGWGYRYFTNWKINKRMTRTSQFVIR